MARRDRDPDQDELPSEFHRERREHGGASQRLDDDKLAELAEEERAELFREIDKGEFRQPSKENPFPPTRYED